MTLATPLRCAWAWKRSTTWMASGKYSPAMFHVQGAPSPRTARRFGRSTPRRLASRSTRRANAEHVSSVSRIAALSMAAEYETEPSSRTGTPSSSHPSALQTVHSFTSRVLEEPSACLPGLPSNSSLRIGTPVPSVAKVHRGRDLGILGSLDTERLGRTLDLVRIDGKPRQIGRAHV